MERGWLLGKGREGTGEGRGKGKGRGNLLQAVRGDRRPCRRVAWVGPYGLPINRKMLSAMTLCLIHIAHTNKLAIRLIHCPKAIHLQFLHGKTGRHNIH